MEPCRTSLILGLIIAVAHAQSAVPVSFQGVDKNEPPPIQGTRVKPDTAPQETPPSGGSAQAPIGQSGKEATPLGSTEAGGVPVGHFSSSPSNDQGSPRGGVMARGVGSKAEEGTFTPIGMTGSGTTWAEAIGYVPSGWDNPQPLPQSPAGWDGGVQATPTIPQQDTPIGQNIHTGYQVKGHDLDPTTFVSHITKLVPRRRRHRRVRRQTKRAGNQNRGFQVLRPQTAAPPTNTKPAAPKQVRSPTAQYIDNLMTDLFKLTSRPQADKRDVLRDINRRRNNAFRKNRVTSTKNSLKAVLMGIFDVWYRGKFGQQRPGTRRNRGIALPRQGVAQNQRVPPQQANKGTIVHQPKPVRTPPLPAPAQHTRVNGIRIQLPRTVQSAPVQSGQTSNALPQPRHVLPSQTAANAAVPGPIQTPQHALLQPRHGLPSQTAANVAVPGPIQTRQHALSQPLHVLQSHTAPIVATPGPVVQTAQHGIIQTQHVAHTPVANVQKLTLFSGPQFQETRPRPIQPKHVVQQRLAQKNHVIIQNPPTQNHVTNQLLSVPKHVIKKIAPPSVPALAAAPDPAPISFWPTSGTQAPPIVEKTNAALPGVQIITVRPKSRPQAASTTLASPTATGTHARHGQVAPIKKLFVATQPSMANVHGGGQTAVPQSGAGKTSVSPGEAGKTVIQEAGAAKSALPVVAGTEQSVLPGHGSGNTILQVTGASNTVLPLNGVGKPAIPGNAAGKLAQPVTGLGKPAAAVTVVPGTPPPVLVPENTTAGPAAKSAAAAASVTSVAASAAAATPAVASAAAPAAAENTAIPAVVEPAAIPAVAESAAISAAPAAAIPAAIPAASPSPKAPAVVTVAATPVIPAAGTTVAAAALVAAINASVTVAQPPAAVNASTAATPVNTTAVPTTVTTAAQQTTTMYISTTTFKPTIDPDLLSDINDQRAGEGLPLLTADQVDVNGKILTTTPTPWHRHHANDWVDHGQHAQGGFYDRSHSHGHGNTRRNNHVRHRGFPGTRAINGLYDTIHNTHLAAHIQSGPMSAEQHRQLHMFLRQWGGNQPRPRPRPTTAPPMERLRQLDPDLYADYLELRNAQAAAA